MKTIRSFVISSEVYDEFDSITPSRENSKVVEEIIKRYLKTGICRIPEKVGGQVYAVTFSIDLKVLQDFRDSHPYSNYSRSLEALIKQYLGTKKN